MTEPPTFKIRLFASKPSIESTRISNSTEAEDIDLCGIGDQNAVDVSNVKGGTSSEFCEESSNDKVNKKKRRSTSKQSSSATAVLPVTKTPRLEQATSDRTKAVNEKLVKKKSLYTVLAKVLYTLKSKDTWGLFLEPVDVSVVTDYLSIVKKPMDFRTMENKMNKRAYRDIQEFKSDFELIIKNAKIYNAPDTIFWKSADKLESFGVKCIDKEASLIDMTIVDEVPEERRPSTQQTMELIEKESVGLVETEEKQRKKYKRSKMRQHIELVANDNFHPDGSQIVFNPSETRIHFPSNFCKYLNMNQSRHHKDHRVRSVDELKASLKDPLTRLTDASSQSMELAATRQNECSALTFLLYGSQVGEAYVNSLLRFTQNHHPKLREFVEKKIDRLTAGGYSIVKQVPESVPQSDSDSGTLPEDDIPSQELSLDTLKPQTVSLGTADSTTDTANKVPNVTSTSDSSLTIHHSADSHYSNASRVKHEPLDSLINDGPLNLETKSTTRSQVSKRQHSTSDTNRSTSATDTMHDFNVKNYIKSLQDQDLKLIQTSEIDAWKRDIVDVGVLLTPISNAVDKQFTSDLAKQSHPETITDNLMDVDRLNSMKQVKKTFDTADGENTLAEKIRRRLLHLVQKAPASQFTARTVPQHIPSMYRSLQSPMGHPYRSNYLG